jgi:anti-sigma-K factor RskA
MKSWIKAFLHAVLAISAAAVIAGLLGLIIYGLKYHENVALVALAVATVAAITCLFKYDINRGGGLW